MEKTFTAGAKLNHPTHGSVEFVEMLEDGYALVKKENGVIATVTPSWLKPVEPTVEPSKSES
jgi:hypothetical protein